MEYKYLKGSDWRIWDLHIHTPKSIVNDYGGDTEETWEKFITQLEKLPEDVKVIGINDYYFIDGYEKVMSYREKGRLQNIEMIFPILEFRVDTFGTNNGKNFLKTNLHILFNVDMENYKQEVQAIKKEFISRIKLSKLSKHQTKELSIENFIAEADDNKLKTGFSNYFPCTEEVLELAKGERWKESTFLFLGFKEWDNTDKGTQLKDYKTEMYDAVNGIFSDTTIDKLDKKKEALERFGDLNLFHSKDIHGFNDFDNYYCYSWLKADPTYEGLKQVFIEPERVLTQENNPSKNISKPYFSSIKFDETLLFESKNVKFSRNHLPLNRDLVAIIGGRGTGKSLLLDAISKILNKAKDNKRANSISELQNFEIAFKSEDGTEKSFHCDGLEENIIDYTHVSQSEVQKIVEDPRSLGDTIFNLLLIKPETLTEKEEATIHEIINGINEIKDWFNQENGDSQLINSLDYNEKLKKEYNKKISSITNEQNKSLIEKYRNNKKIKMKYEVFQSNTNELVTELAEAEQEINKKFNALNEEFSDFSPVPMIDLKEQSEALKKLNTHILSLLELAKSENSQIESEFRSEGIEGDISTLLGKVQGYQLEIEKCEQKIQTIKDKQLTLGILLERRKKFADYLNNKMLEQKQKIDTKWIDLKKGNDDWKEEQKELVQKILDGIDVYADIHFDKDIFYTKLERLVNGTKFRTSKKSVETKRDKLEAFFNVKFHSDFMKLLSNEPIIIIDPDEPEISLEQLLTDYPDYLSSHGEYQFSNYLFSSVEREQYLKVVPKVKYNGKDPEELSIGQRGTLFISLKLATDSFSNPFIFDQPEDDLDNKFIVDKLIPILKDLKKYRQIIIVTHNANIVVNADADQVIVAHNESEELSYISGSLENTFTLVQPVGGETQHPLKVKGIKEHVCDILEGGKAAFDRREKKYAIKSKEIHVKKKVLQQI
ncbi:TrlF family AAA-like ATPase [Priestia megaterium]